MIGRRDIDVLMKIIDYCDEIYETVELFGEFFEIMSSNKTYRNATAMCVLQIGELTIHLSDDFKAVYSEMPWQDMKNMRNMAAHGYGKFNLEKLWETIIEDIPALREYCNQIIQQNRNA